MLPMFCIVAGLGIVVGLRQDSICTYCEKALEDFFPDMVAQQRSSINVERLRALGAAIYYSSEVSVRREARLEAQALAMDAVFERSMPSYAHLKTASEHLRRIAALRDQQALLQERIHHMVWKIRALQWNIFKEVDRRSSEEDLRVLHDVDAFLEQLRSVGTQEAFDGLRGASDPLLARLEAFGDRHARYASILITECRSLEAAVRESLPLYAAYLKDAEDASRHWKDFDSGLRALSESFSTSASRRIHEALQSIFRIAAHAERAAVGGFLLLMLSLLAGLLLGRAFVVTPILWIAGELQRIRAGRRLFAMPSFLIRELQYMANALTAFSFYLHDVETQSEQLETEKLKFEALSFRDGLTGIYNRRYFDLILAKEWRVAQARQTPLSLLMIDVDKFKNYNDSQGHLMGDDCLRRLAAVLSGAVLRPTDKSARYGGEEFALLLPGVGSEGAVKVAQRVHEGIHALGIVHPASDVAPVITVSIGAASCTPQTADTPSLLVERADRALYAAKSQGRNRTCVDEESADEEHPC